MFSKMSPEILEIPYRSMVPLDQCAKKVGDLQIVVFRGNQALFGNNLIHSGQSVYSGVR